MLLVCTKALQKVAALESIKCFPNQKKNLVESAEKKTIFKTSKFSGPKILNEKVFKEQFWIEAILHFWQILVQHGLNFLQRWRARPLFSFIWMRAGLCSEDCASSKVETRPNALDCTRPDSVSDSGVCSKIREGGGEILSPGRMAFLPCIALQTPLYPPDWREVLGRI